jgi:hypothetical protein
MKTQRGHRGKTSHSGHSYHLSCLILNSVLQTSFYWQDISVATAGTCFKKYLSEGVQEIPNNGYASEVMELYLYFYQNGNHKGSSNEKLH